MYPVFRVIYPVMCYSYSVFLLTALYGKRSGPTIISLPCIDSFLLGLLSGLNRMNLHHDLPGEYARTR